MTKKRILILSYFFPPCNLTASNRAYAWAKYFDSFGLRPTVITRNWNIDVSKPEDLHKGVGEEIEYEHFEHYDLIKVPFKPNFRDKLFTKAKPNGLDIFTRKILTIAELILQNIFWFATPYKSIYHQAEVELEKGKFDALLVTGNPFIFFKFGYLLSKKFKIKWFADYRDDWSTAANINLWYFEIPLLKHLANFLEKVSEQRWLANSQCFFSVSENYVDKISAFVLKKGYVVYNGFFAEDFEPFLNLETNEEFTVCFNGTLIDIQPIELFLEAFKKVMLRYESKVKMKIVFVGTSFHNNQDLRIKKILKGFEHNMVITNRIDQLRAIEMQSKAHVLLLVAFTDVKGAPGSKIFDYLALQKPVILCPSDHDIMEKIITSTNQGIVCNTSIDIENTLEKLVENFISNQKKLVQKLNYEAINYYSRQNQSKLMAEKILEYL